MFVLPLLVLALLAMPGSGADLAPTHTADLTDGFRPIAADITSPPSAITTDTTPRLVLSPEGVPVMAIPLGPGVYQPLDGGPPTPGPALN